MCLPCYEEKCDYLSIGVVTVQRAQVCCLRWLHLQELCCRLPNPWWECLCRRIGNCVVREIVPLRLDGIQICVNVVSDVSVGELKNNVHGGDVTVAYTNFCCLKTSNITGRVSLFFFSLKQQQEKKDTQNWGIELEQIETTHTVPDLQFNFLHKKLKPIYYDLIRCVLVFDCFRCTVSGCDKCVLINHYFLRVTSHSTIGPEC